MRYVLVYMMLVKLCSWFCNTYECKFVNFPWVKPQYLTNRAENREHISFPNRAHIKPIKHQQALRHVGRSL